MPVSSSTVARIARVTALIASLQAAQKASNDPSPFLEWLSETKSGDSAQAADAGELLAALVEDHRTTSDKLNDAYSGSDSWGAHPLYKPVDWRTEVENEETRQGYWDWVLSQLDMELTDVEMG